MRTGTRSLAFESMPIRGFALATVLLLTMAAPCPADDKSDGAKAYLAGLDALSAGKWPDAVAAFSKAADFDEENADYLTARGVAQALNQQPAAAIKDLQRSLRMRGNDWETKLWLWVSYNMNRDPGTGAQYTTHGPPVALPPKADLDYSNYVYTMSVHYLAAVQNGQYVDFKTKKAMTIQEIVAAEFPKAGALFASRRQAAAPPQLAGNLLERAKTSMENKQFAAALKDFDSLLASSPEDDNLLLFHASALLNLGDYSGSRVEFTRVLTDQPNWPIPYVGRALAAAHLADGARANSDLAIAEKLGAENVKAYRQQVDTALAGIKPQDPAEAMAQLEKAAQAGESGPKLAELALAVTQSVNAHRRRYNEIYQDRLRVLDKALRSQPKDPVRLADMADFLFKESEVPCEEVEPRIWPTYYRYTPLAIPQLGRRGEIEPAPGPRREPREVNRAMELADAALAVNPNHVKSLGVKVAILNSLAQYQQARPLLEKALAITPDDPELLHLLADTLEGMARENLAEAAELRRVRTFTSPHTAGGIYTVTTINPSPAALARADALEKSAAHFRQLAAEDMAKAIKLTAGTAMGFYYTGLVERAAGHGKEAQAAFQKAVSLDKTFRKGWDQLTMVDQDLGLPEEWAAARSAGLNLIQTTAAPWLTYTRSQIVKTKFKSAREALAHARELDPADARIPAYLGVIDAANDKRDGAQADYRMAIALEQARNQLHGRDLAQRGQPGPLPITPADIGLTLALRDRIGAILFQQGQMDQAFQQFQANLAFLSPLPPESLATAVPQAVLPSSTLALGDVPRNETYASLKIRAQAGLECVKWVRRYNDPKDVALATETFRRLVADANVTDPNPEVLQAVMSLALAELETAKGHYQEADELLKNRGATPQPLWQEMRKVQQQIDDGRRTAQDQQNQQEMQRVQRLTPAQLQREYLLREKKRMEQLKQGVLEQLNDPNLTDAQKRASQGTITFYDARIADCERRLQQLDPGGIQNPPPPR
jgi:tetratricopeptide (TPR) repeat protein